MNSTHGWSPRSGFWRILLGTTVLMTPVCGHGQQRPSVGSPPLTFEALESLRVVSEARVAPDGSLVLYRLLLPQEEGVGWRAEIWRIGTDGEGARRLMSNGGRVRWSPRGDRFAFLASDEEGRQIWLASPDGSGRRRLTAAPGGVRDYVWSPDGERIAYVAPADGTLQLFVQGTGDASPRQLTNGKDDVHVDFFGGGAGFDWAPDGRRIAFATQPATSFEDAYRTQLFQVDVATSAVRALVQRPGMDYRPRWSPTGEWIAFVTSFEAEDRLAPHGLALVDSSGQAVRDVGRSIDAAFLDVPSDPAWSPDRSEIFLQAAHGVERRLLALDVESGSLRTLVENGGVVARASYSRNRSSVVFLGSNPERPYDVYQVRLEARPRPRPDGEPRRLTHLNPQIEARNAGTLRRFRWTDAEGRALEGLVVLPEVPAESGDRKPPVVVWLHGGPEGHAVRTFDPTLPFPGVPFDPFPIRILAARGYAVFLPNFRGSAGYGAEFRRAAVGRPAGRAAEDVLSGLQALADSGLVDPDRAAALGWASGAFKVAYLLTFTDRFSAAAFGAGHTELHAAVGEGDAVIQWRSLYAGLPWEVPRRYLEESPLLHAERISTPTLLIHGGSDPLVPVGQSRQLHTYLRLRDVPSRLEVVPDEGHGIAHPGRRRRVGEAVTDWLDRWLCPANSTDHRSSPTGPS